MQVQTFIDTVVVILNGLHEDLIAPFVRNGHIPLAMLNRIAGLWTLRSQARAFSVCFTVASEENNGINPSTNGPELTRIA